VISGVRSASTFTSDPAMKAYIAAKADTASGKLRERLTFILSRS
jgi:hypothetical protein